jgi:subtilisin family serine protease
VRISTRLAGVAAGLLTLGLTAALPAGTTSSWGDPAGDPKVVDQWGLQQVRALDAWATSTGEGATIAILDTGVDLDHEDLADNIVPGATFVFGCNPSCGDGDWESGEDPPAGDPHGTHVAGIAAAVGGNGIGISGVAPHATIMPVKVLSSEGSGSFQDIGRGIRWAVDNGADVINMSLGALPGVQALEITGLMTDTVDAIAYANANGVVVVAAAGNEAFPICDTPAFSDGVICVGGTDVNGAKAWYSNHPINPSLLGVSAPGGTGAFFVCGVEILSTVPMGTSWNDCDEGDNYEELFWFGTSMAAPHVAGVAALVMAQGCDRDQTIDAIISTAYQPVLGASALMDPVWGHGIVDATAAVAVGAEVCAPPTGGGDNGDDGDDTGGGRGGPPEGRGPGNAGGPPEGRGPNR